MAISLYDLRVPNFLQTVRAVGGFLERVAIHCADTGIDPDDFVEARLFDDTAPFHFQIEAAWHHAAWWPDTFVNGHQMWRSRHSEASHGAELCPEG
jgi:uncharacterized protein